MKKHSIMRYSILVVILVAGMLLAACRPTTEPTPSAEEVAQQVAATQQAKATQNAVETLIAEVTRLSAPTATPVPTNTPAPTPTQSAPTAIIGSPVAATATSTTAPADTGSKCYKMEFLGDVNYPPATVVTPGKEFDKTWQVRNAGTCAWSTDFDLLLVGGDAMGTNKRGDITSVVYPGDIVDLTIHMKAPLTEGTYYGYWMIVDPLGARFGYGPNNEWSLGIEIEVKK
ncbi:MAG TPA: NBR1-Ig-like domain-containing protein [Anaerolineaceae bacterium]|jgi:type II secretory pathway pseudopilin PulG|nr:NBR1-Ig-like domain-containing protein [Anaerolineaceae bacterium]